jgi:hypothetical protein
MPPCLALRDRYEGSKSDCCNKRPLPYLPSPETPSHAEPLQTLLPREAACSNQFYHLYTNMLEFISSRK